MSLELLVLCGAILVVFIVLLILKVLAERRRPAYAENEAAPQRPRGVPVLRGDGVEAPRRGGRNVRARMRAATTRQQEEEEDDDVLADDIALPDGKVGVKKRKKLELKAEKRKERERELEEREERKQRLAQLEELRKKEEAKAKEEELRQEEEEKALKEEQARKEHEEYLKLKESFAVEEEGFDQEEVEEEGNKLQEFINYIKNQKVVLLEDLASRFKLKTQAACFSRRVGFDSKEVWLSVWCGSDGIHFKLKLLTGYKIFLPRSGLWV